MKIVSRILSLCMAICLMTVIANALENYPEPIETSVDILTLTDSGDGLRGSQWPTTSWNISTNGNYSGSISSIQMGYGVYTNYYFLPDSLGRLRVTATLTALYPLYPQSKCIIEIYNAVTHNLVASYDPGYAAYLNKYLSHTFYLSTATPYVVRFYNATVNTEHNPLHGSISVEFP